MLKQLTEIQNEQDKVAKVKIYFPNWVVTNAADKLSNRENTKYVYLLMLKCSLWGENITQPAP